MSCRDDRVMVDRGDVVTRVTGDVVTGWVWLRVGVVPEVLW